MKSFSCKFSLRIKKHNGITINETKPATAKMHLSSPVDESAIYMHIKRKITPGLWKEKLSYL